MDIGYDGMRKHSLLEVTRTNGERFRCDKISGLRMTRYLEPGEEGYRPEEIAEVAMPGPEFVKVTCTFIDRPPDMMYLSDIAQIVEHTDDGPRTLYPPRDSI